MATTQEVISKVFLNTQQAEDKLKQLEEQTKKFRAEWDKAAKNADMKGMKAAEKEIKRCEKEMKAFHTTASQVNKVLSNLSTAGPKELETTIKAINRELSSGKVQRGSEEWKVLQEQLKRCKTELASIRQESKAFDDRGFFTKTADFLNKQWFVITSVIQSLTGLSASIRKTVQDFLDLDTAMANVRKYTGQVKEEVEAMNEKFRQMDTRTPINELNELAGAAGRLGITAEDDILEFVDAADKIGVALGDDLGDGAVDQIGKLAMAFGEDDKMGLRGAMLATGSAINELAQNSAAKAGYLVEFGARIAAVGNQVGLTQAQIFGLGAVLDENMQRDEMAATAVSQLLIKMSKDTATFAKLAGKPVEEFSKMVREDFNGALTALFQNLHKVEDMESLANMFDDMGLDGIRCVTVLATMAGKIDDITRLQNLATKAYKEGTSVIEEHSIQNNTLQAYVDKAKNKFLQLSVTLGEKLLPVVKYTVNGGSMLIKIMSVLIEFISEHKVAIVSTTAALVAYTIALQASNIAFKIHYAWIVVVERAQKALRITTIVMNAVWAVLTGNVTKATAAMRLFNIVTKANPWGLLASVITAAVAALATWILTSDKASEAERKHAQEVKNLIDAKQHVKDLETEAASSAEQAATRIRKLNDVLHNGNLKYSQRKAALDELQKIIPGYHAQLTKEGKLLRDNTDAIDGYIQKLIMQATVNAFADDLAKMNKELAELEVKRERINGSINAVHRQMDKTPQKETVINPYTGDLQEVTTTEWHKQTQALKTHTQRLNDVQEKIDAVNAKIAETNKALDKTLEKNEEAVKALGQGSGVGGGYKSKKQLQAEERERKRLEAEKKKLETEAEKARKDLSDSHRAATTMAVIAEKEKYVQGLTTYRDYLEKIYQLELEGIAKRKDVWKDDPAQYAKVCEEEQRLKEKHEEVMEKMDIDALERRRRSHQALLEAQFYDQNSDIFQNEEALNEALFCEDMEYLAMKQDLYAKGTKDWYDIEMQMTELEENRALERRIAYAEKLQDYREQWGRLDFEIQKDIALKGLDMLKEQGLMSEEEYQRMRLAIIAEYSQKAIDQEREEKSKATSDILQQARSKVSSQDRDLADSNLNDAGIGGQLFGIATTIKNYRTMYDEIERMRQENQISDAQAAMAEKELRLQTMQEIVSAVNAAYNSINQIVNAAAAYSKACSDYEVAKITADYDKQIEAAGKNSKKKERLEKERDAKIRKAKTAASKKAMKIELAQAFASTSLAAINAYASAAQVPMIGYILAPVAAGMALAAGALQIATIKKQHQTEEMGYYSGGFTKGRNYRREAGVVHEGEFVANHNAVNNPNLLPFFEFVDQAQKNNTVSALTAADVRSISGNGGTVVAPIVNVQNNNDDLNAVLLQMSETTQQLKERLDDGIHADVYADEMDKAIKKLNKLINNAHA